VFLSCGRAFIDINIAEITVSRTQWLGRCSNACMASNLNKFKADLEKLTTKGEMLRISMQLECYPNETTEKLDKQFEDKLRRLSEPSRHFALNTRSGIQKRLRWCARSYLIVWQI
jgi:hypothetical protein